MELMQETYVRNSIFGIVDSLVSTVGLLSGLGASGASAKVLVATGVIYAFVEAFSMAVGSFLSERATEEYVAQAAVKQSTPLVGGVIMFVSFVIASFVPIVPYLFFVEPLSLIISVTASLALLLIVGGVIASISKIHVLKHALSTALLGGAAIIIGVVIGRIIPGG